MGLPSIPTTTSSMTSPRAVCVIPCRPARAAGLPGATATTITPLRPSLRSTRRRPGGPGPALQPLVGVDLRADVHLLGEAALHDLRHDARDRADRHGEAD